MNENFEALEKRLKNLEPLEQDVLAAKILENWQIVKREDSSAAPPIFTPILGGSGSASPRSCYFVSLSLCSACIGAIFGAAAMFLGMTFLVAPKVEIREVVREVRVPAEPTIKGADRQASPTESVSEKPFNMHPKARIKFDDRFLMSSAFSKDLDTLLADRDARVRQMARYESNAGSAANGFVRPRTSPEQYRELLRDLKL
jgi:hypothetical protein